MGMQCSVCKLAISKRLLIEERLLNGASYASVARELEVSEWSLANHFKNHLTDEQHADHTSLALLDSDDPIENINGMIGLAKAAVRETKRKAHVGLLLSAMERLEKLFGMKKVLEEKKRPDAEGGVDYDWTKLTIPEIELFRKLLSKLSGDASIDIFPIEDDPDEDDENIDPDPPRQQGRFRRRDKKVEVDPIPEVVPDEPEVETATTGISQVEYDRQQRRKARMIEGRSKPGH